MKRFAYIVAALLLAASCGTKDPVRDLLLERTASLSAPESVTYDAPNSTATVLAIYWDATKALENGAVEFHVDVATDEFFFSGDGGTLITRDIPVSSSPNDAIMITGLTSGQSYFVRVAAVYPGPSKSEWAYLNGANGKPVAVIPGTGLVE
jgi:hypothetical protein